MSRQFLIRKQDEMAGPVELQRVYEYLDNHLKVGDGLFTRTKNGEKVGRPLRRPPAIQAAEDAVRNGAVGDVIRVFNAKDDEVARVREVSAAVDVIDTNGNDKADAYWTLVKGKWPDTMFQGSLVCKNISGTNEHSQHSYGNAVDVYRKTFDLMWEVAHWAEANYSSLSIEHIIIDGKAWTRGEGWHTYEGEYHYHVHVDFAPEVNPSRPCGLVET